MKRNKVLLGLFAGVLALIGGTASAQTSKFYEIGPSNVGGRVSSLVADNQDTEHTTLYAGATTGGLYMLSDNSNTLRAYYNQRGNKDSILFSGQTDMWHYIPYVENGQEVVLPISVMTQGPAAMNNEIIIGTGTNAFPVGSTFSYMSTVGKGIFRYNTKSGEFKRISGTMPNDVVSTFSAVNSIEYIVKDNTLYLYVATATGLYRWSLEIGADGTIDESQWAVSPEQVFVGGVEQFIVSRQVNMAYFTSYGRLFMIGNAVSDLRPEPIDITSTNSAFGYLASYLKLAVSDSDPSFLYVMVVSMSTGAMENIYLTRDMQTWTKLATASVRPFTFNAGNACGCVVVDPANPRHIYIAGSTIYSGTGYVDGNSYQWMKQSNCEGELVYLYGDYMQYVYNNNHVVHSGIQQILPVYRVVNGVGTLTYYMATDGGVYSTTNFTVYENLNNGLNNLQIVDLDVAPDGSIVSGASANACQFIKSRDDHDSGDVTISWFDNGSLGSLNHTANVIWHGSGGHVAASMFQQLQPELRRNIYVSSENGAYGRSFNNYFNFLDNQVWTIDSSFLTKDPLGGGPQIGMLYNWETYTDTIFNDSINVTFDTLGYVKRPNSVGGYNNALIGSSNFIFQPGDVLNVLSRANCNYPIEYEFTKKHSIKDPLRIKNPIQSRMLIIATDRTKTEQWGVYISWRASDFTKVFEVEQAEYYPDQILWIPILWTDPAISAMKPCRPRTMVMSEDGRFVYVAVQNTSTNKSLIIRVKNFDKVDFSKDESSIKKQLTGPGPKYGTKFSNEDAILAYDTLRVNGNGDVWFDRPVSSIAVAGDSLVLTFEDYAASGSLSNTGIVKNISSNMTFEQLHYTGDTIPAFSAMVEQSTGNIYVGTAEGVKIYGKSNHQWGDYDYLKGVPVTAIVQQKANLPVRHHIGHSGIDEVKYVFSKTKWPRAIYFGTYGRGIFMDMTYVTDTVNASCDSADYLGIPTVTSSDLNSVSVYPNPVSDVAHLHLNTAIAGNAQLRVYDINGRCVMSSNLGYANEGEQTYAVSTEGMSRGMYLVNVIIGGYTAAAKMMVR